ncbi:hypothetical protein PanWU01x14_219150 [Parasponia andersonii]|uniref:Uncharacterized protein n=1 Tax=Parasponia andersonii TaxID=3476 RepID=A0A2P5BQI1_PARAD|nr:hypothetical protein PanWU01x14_219150 [Parasponia andersonii]
MHISIRINKVNAKACFRIWQFCHILTCVQGNLFQQVEPKQKAYKVNSVAEFKGTHQAKHQLSIQSHLLHSSSILILKMSSTKRTKTSPNCRHLLLNTTVM